MMRHDWKTHQRRLGAEHQTARREDAKVRSSTRMRMKQSPLKGGNPSSALQEETI